MLDYLLAADLAALTICQAILVWHCFRMEGKVPEYIDNHATNLSGMLTEVGSILEDIATVLEASPSAPPSGANRGLGESIPGILTDLFLAKMNMAGEHGITSEQVGTVHEGEQSSSSE
jgi:hypothetical protein